MCLHVQYAYSMIPFIGSSKAYKDKNMYFLRIKVVTIKNKMGPQRGEDLVGDNHVGASELSVKFYLISETVVRQLLLTIINIIIKSFKLHALLSASFASI